MTNKINLTFKKFFRKLEILLQNKDSINRKTAKSIQKDVKNIFKTIKLSRILKTSFKNIVSIIIEVAYETEIFRNAGNIEITYKVAYQKIIKKENYLKLLEEETVTQLLSYIKNILYLKPSSKRKGKNIRNIILLILLTKIQGSVLPILPAYI